MQGNENSTCYSNNGKFKLLLCHTFTHIENVVGLLAETIRLREKLKDLHEED